MSKGSKNPWKPSHRNKFLRYLYIYNHIHVWLYNYREYNIYYAHLVITYHSFYPKHVPNQMWQTSKKSEKLCSCSKALSLTPGDCSNCLGHTTTGRRFLRAWSAFERWLFNLNAHPKREDTLRGVGWLAIIERRCRKVRSRCVFYRKTAIQNAWKRWVFSRGGRGFDGDFCEQFLTRWHKSLTCMTEMHQMKQVLK